MLHHPLRSTRRPPRSTLSPYTPLFRSGRPELPVRPAPTVRRGPRALRERQDLKDPPEAPSRPACSSRPWRSARSEEHTSELQSLRHIVCSLLLAKKTNQTAGRNDSTNI